MPHLRLEVPWILAEHAHDLLVATFPIIFARVSAAFAGELVELVRVPLGERAGQVQRELERQARAEFQGDQSAQAAVALEPADLKSKGANELFIFENEEFRKFSNFGNFWRCCARVGKFSAHVDIILIIVCIF